jgi:ribosomal protein S18 acetylase RimI-like enzyme
VRRDARDGREGQPAHARHRGRAGAGDRAAGRVGLSGAPGIAIRRLGARDEDAVDAAEALFDRAPLPDATRRFLAEPTHHLLLAWLDGEPEAAGFVTGVEMTHPDKGTEMFLYELGVAERARGRGVGRALVAALADLARERGCYGMWTATERDNAAAQRTYAAAGARILEPQTMVEWRLGERPDA